MLQSTYRPKPAELAGPAGFAFLRDLFHATPLYLFVTGAKAASESAKRR
jgi:hypothetical protein